MIQWFETHFGWLFIEPKRRAIYAEYLRKKYNK